MKIWTVTYNDDSGVATSVHLTESSAEEACRQWVVGAWTEGDGDIPDDWREAYEKLQDSAGFIDSIHLEEHDLTALRPPPRKGAWNHALSMAIEVFSDKQDASDLTDTEIIEAFRRELDELDGVSALGSLLSIGAIDRFDTMAAEEPAERTRDDDPRLQGVPV